MHDLAGRGGRGDPATDLLQGVERSSAARLPVEQHRTVQCRTEPTGELLDQFDLDSFERRLVVTADQLHRADDSQRPDDGTVMTDRSPICSSTSPPPATGTLRGRRR